ncbi:MAG: hypothetical protein F6K47_43365, partial [Symploca sp. SIO2E6]|nr:hypothetical protein [Symploca sp. SIO2E6]
LNRVHLRGLSVDQAIAAIALTGIEPQLSYQWNPDYNEIDVLVVISLKPLEETTDADERRENQLWEIFGDEVMLSIGNGTGKPYPNFLVCWHLERVTPPAPPKPDWQVEPKREIQSTTV